MMDSCPHETLALGHREQLCACLAPGPSSTEVPGWSQDTDPRWSEIGWVVSRLVGSGSVICAMDGLPRWCLHPGGTTEWAASSGLLLLRGVLLQALAAPPLSTGSVSTQCFPLVFLGLQHLLNQFSVEMPNVFSVFLTGLPGNTSQEALSPLFSLLQPTLSSASADGPS